MPLSCALSAVLSFLLSPSVPHRYQRQHPITCFISDEKKICGIWRTGVLCCWAAAEAKKMPKVANNARANLAEPKNLHRPSEMTQGKFLKHSHKILQNITECCKNARIAVLCKSNENPENLYFLVARLITSNANNQESESSVVGTNLWESLGAPPMLWLRICTAGRRPTVRFQSSKWVQQCDNGHIAHSTPVLACLRACIVHTYTIVNAKKV